MHALLFLSSLVIPLTNGAKILLIPTDHVPEVRAFSQLGLHLKSKGHHPVILSPARHRHIVSKMNIEAVYVQEDRSYFLFEDKERMIHMGKQTGWRNLAEVMSGAYNLTEQIYAHAKNFATNLELIKQLEDEKFDIAIVNAIELSQSLFIIPYKLDIPYISLTWEITSWTVQLSEMPSISGQFGIHQFLQTPNFADRLLSLMLHTLVYNIYPHLYHSDKHIAELVPEKPITSYQDLVRKSEVILITRDNFCMDYPRLESPHVHYIGGATPPHMRPLPPKYEAFARGATHGLVVVSFGSIMHPFEELMATLMETFRKLPQRFVMRYDVGKTYKNVPDNVLLSKWIPQNDLLRHNNTVLFLGHGGQCGQAEAHYHGVPMIVMPFIWDQEYAAQRVEIKGYGKYVHKHTTSENLYNIIVEVINNPVYKQNLNRCSRIIKSLPSSHDSIEWWVNHVVEFGGDHLKPQFGEMSAFKFFMIDVLLVLCGLSIGLTFVSMKCCLFCKRRIFCVKVKTD